MALFYICHFLSKHVLNSKYHVTVIATVRAKGGQ